MMEVTFVVICLMVGRLAPDLSLTLVEKVMVGIGVGLVVAFTNRLLSTLYWHAADLAHERLMPLPEPVAYRRVVHRNDL